MGWSFLLSFGIALVAYLVVVLLIGLYKKHKNKKGNNENAKVDKSNINDKK